MDVFQVEKKIRGRVKKQMEARTAADAAALAAAAAGGVT